MTSLEWLSNLLGMEPAKSRELENLRRYKTIFDSKVIGILASNLDGRIYDANQYFLDMVGYTRSDLEAGLLNWEKLTPPEFLQQSRDMAALLLRQGSVSYFEKEYLRKDGRRIPVRLGLTLFEDGTVITLVSDISDQKEASKKLEEANALLEARVARRTKELAQSEAFLSAIIENMPNMVFVKDAENLKFVRFNKAGERLLGLPREELIGKTDFDFFPKEQAEFFRSQDQEAIKNNKILDIPEEPIKGTNGMRYLHTTKIPIVNKDGKAEYLLGVSEDITVRKEAEAQRFYFVQEQLAREAAELRAQQMSFLSELSFAMTESFDLEQILKSFTNKAAPTLGDVCIVDILDEEEIAVVASEVGGPDFKVTNFLRKWRKEHKILFDAPVGVPAVVRTGLTEIINSVDIDSFIEKTYGAEAARQAPKIADVEAIMTVPLKIRDQRPIGAFILMSITKGRKFSTVDQLLAEEIARRLAVVVENSRLYYRAQEASRAKTAFLANVSHEIRTPLGAMLGFAEILKEDTTLNEEQREAVDTVLRNGQQLLRIVDEILDISKVESERLLIEHIVFSLPDLLQDIIHLLRGRAEEKGIELRLVAPDLPAQIRSDPTRLRQILINVIGNAIKFTDEGYVQIELRQKKKSGFLLELEFEISDTGIGISSDDRVRLFQPFSQADSSTTRRFGGTGLGLFLSRKLARLLGGDVALMESTEGFGSRFIVTIQAETPLGRITPLIDENQQKSTSQGDTSHVKNILIVDDASDNRELFKRYLERVGLKENQIDLAENGRVALDMALKTSYSLILMDIQMPEMNGFQTLEVLRSRGYRGPVVALTAHAMKGDREKCLEAGFDEYLKKPLDREDLKRVLRLDFLH